MEKDHVQNETKETQTVYDEGDFENPCKNCIYEASCEDELRYHVEKEHEFRDTDQDTKFSCGVCYKKFNIKDDLSIHKRKIHVKKNNIFKYFLRRICHYDEN